MQAAGALGCFALTEKFAGVSSGMVVETTAEFDAARNEFVISTPSEGAKKNWISQGFVADKAVVVADLRVGGASHGPHAFLMDFRVGGALAPGVRLADMGKKTVCNDLDNAWIAFDGVRVPRSALLDGQCSLDAAGTYQAAAGVHPMEMIGQRLFTGRVAVAQSALVFGPSSAGARIRRQWIVLGAGAARLSLLPQLSACTTRRTRRSSTPRGTRRRASGGCAGAARGQVEAGARRNRRRQGARGRDGDPALLPAQAGDRGYALMKGSGFEGSARCRSPSLPRASVRADAEARDRVKRRPVDAVGDGKAAIVEELKRAAEWLAKAEKVYALAELVMDRAMRAEVGAGKGVARPWAASCGSRLADYTGLPAGDRRGGRRICRDHDRRAPRAPRAIHRSYRRHHRRLWQDRLALHQQLAADRRRRPPFVAALSSGAQGAAARRS